VLSRRGRLGEHPAVDGDPAGHPALVAAALALGVEDEGRVLLRVGELDAPGWPPGSAKMADGSSGLDANSSGWTRPSGQASDATVCVVPKSIPRRNPDGAVTPANVGTPRKERRRRWRGRSDGGGGGI